MDDLKTAKGLTPFQEVVGEVIGSLRKLDPKHWQQVIEILNYYIETVYEKEGVVLDETPVIARNVRLPSHLRLISK